MMLVAVGHYGYHSRMMVQQQVINITYSIRGTSSDK